MSDLAPSRTAMLTAVCRAVHLPFAGTVEWTYRFEPDSDGTLVTESYTVSKALSPIGWFIIGVLFARKDRRSDLRAGMEQTLQRLRQVAEQN